MIYKSGAFGGYMDFKSQGELYLWLMPVFNVKSRINRYYGYKVNNKDIWSYLVNTKWKKTKDLCLSMIVNDIITLDVYEMRGKLYE